MDPFKLNGAADGPPPANDGPEGHRTLTGPQYDPSTRSSPWTVAPHTRRVTEVPAEIAAAWRQMLRTEGKSGRAARIAIIAKHTTYFLTVVLVCAAVSGLLGPYPDLSAGSTLLFASVTVMFATASIGGMANPQSRGEVADLLRRSAFSYTLFPALAIAALARSLDALGINDDADLFARTIHQAIPWLFIADVVFPCLLCVKTVVGLRSMQRNALDVEEEVGIWTRQDGLQR